MVKAFRANENSEKFKGGRERSSGSIPRKSHGIFKGECFGCDQVGHLKRDYYGQRSGSGSDAVSPWAKSA